MLARLNASLVSVDTACVEGSTGRLNSARGFREYVRNKPGTAARAVDLIHARTGREGRVPASIGLYIVEKHRQKIQVSCVRVYILGNNDSDNRAQKK